MNRTLEWMPFGRGFFPSLRFWQFQEFNSSAVHFEFLRHAKIILWTCKAEFLWNFIRVLTLTFCVPLKAVSFMLPVTYCQNLPNTQGWIYNLQDKITSFRSFKERQDTGTQSRQSSFVCQVFCHSLKVT